MTVACIGSMCSPSVARFSVRNATTIAPTHGQGEDEAVQGIADYQFVRPLGESNYGTNYLATPPGRLGIAESEVVVKVIAGPTSDDAFRRATRELKHFSVA